MKESKKKYYSLLNLSNFASLEEIRKSYYLIAQKCHPDRQKDSSSSTMGKENFALITQAFNTLKDPEKKAQYDEKLRQEINQEKEEKHQIKDASPAQSPRTARGSSSIAVESFQQGMVALQTKQYPRALYLFRTAMKKDPQNAAYLSYYALSLIYNKGKLSEGIHYASRAIEKEPFRLDFKLNIAKIYFTVGARSQAAKWTFEVLELDPDHKEAQKLAAQLQPAEQEEKGDFISSIKRLFKKGKK